MPELPEAETIRRDLERTFAGQRVERVQVSGTRSVRRHQTAEEFQARVEGRLLRSVARSGKYLQLRLDTRDVVVVHLGMSGQLLAAHPKDPLGKHTHVVFDFSAKRQLRFVDPRTFGELFVTAAESVGRGVPELDHLGFDPVEDHMRWTELAELLGEHRARLKPLLTNQRFVAGIGNIYADEILFAAGLRPDRQTTTLAPQEVRRLYRAMVETLQEAIRARGSSLADEQYRDLFGRTGEFQLAHNVYAREGQACPRCHGSIVRLRSGGRSTFFCPRCQV